MPNSYPIAKGILLRFPNGGYQSIGGIFVEAKSQEQRNQIVQELSLIHILYQWQRPDPAPRMERFAFHLLV